MYLISRPFFLLLAFSFFLTPGTGQDNKISIVPFFSAQRQFNEATEQIYAMALTEFINSGRATFVERSDFDYIEAEKIFQAGADVAIGEAIDLDNSLGATHLLLGKTTHCNTVRKRNDDGSTYFTCDLKVSIRMVNIETGVIEFVDNWEGGGLLCFNTADNAAGATAKTVKCMRQDVKKFIANTLVLKGSIKKVIDDNEFIISLGHNDGINQGDRLKVFSTERIDGEIFNTELGEVKVKTINGPSLCTVNVRRGSTAIAMAIQAGAEIILKSKP